MFDHLAGAGAQAAGVQPLFEAAPQRQREEADQDVRLDAALFVVEDRPQPEVALGGAERGLGLGELHVPAPQQRRVGLLAVGAQQVRAFLAVGLLTGGQQAAHAQGAGTALRIVFELGLHDHGGGGTTA